MKEQTIFSLIHTMSRVTNQLIIQWNEIFKEEIGISHLLVLSHLNTYGKSRPSDVAKALGLTAPTLTHLAEKLVQRQFATRFTDEKDRRINYLEITQEGINILKKANQESHELHKNLFEKLTEEETQQLLNIYEKLDSDTV